MRARRVSVALVVALCLAAAPAVASAATIHFSILDPSGTPQFSHYIVLPSGDPPPVAEDWWSADSTTAPGEATLSVAPGSTVYFNRTADVSDKEGELVPPEGIAGVPYEVTASTSADVTVTLPSAGSVYKPALSGAEEWLLGEINSRRVQEGESKLKVSTTLTAAAGVEARDEAVHHRWPDPYFFVVNQDQGWPGDIASEGYAEADAPFSDPQRVLTHWDGDTSDSESPGIWQALTDASLRYVGIADGEGAWIIQATDGCPDPGAEAACGLTSDSGDTSAWEPTEIAIGSPADGHTYARGEQVASDYACAAPSPAGVAVARCEGPVARGGSIDTSTTGPHSFTVTATDANGDTTSRTVGYQVREAAPAAVAAPTISGTPTIGAQVSGAPGAWSGSPTHFVYEWQRCPSAGSRDGCQTIQNDDLPATAGGDRYTVQPGDYGNYVVLEVKGVNAEGEYGEAFSTPVRAQAAPPAIEPGNFPTVAGPSQPRVGDVLQGSPGQWAGTQPILLSYGWLRCPDTVIKHCIGVQTDSDGRYALTQGDVGDRMLLVVTAHNASGQSAKAFAPSFTGVVEESAASLMQAARTAKTVSGQVGSVSGGGLLEGEGISITVGGPEVIDLLGSATLISDKGLGLTEEQVEELIGEIEAGLISDKGLGLIGDQLISDKGLGLISHDGGSRVPRLELLARVRSGPRKPQPLFAGAHKFKRRGKGRIHLRLTGAGRRRVQRYEKAVKVAARRGRKPKPLRITLVTVAAPLHGHGDAVFHLRTILVRP